MKIKLLSSRLKNESWCIISNIDHNKNYNFYLKHVDMVNDNMWSCPWCLTKHHVMQTNGEVEV
jgi:hypothetical protein